MAATYETVRTAGEASAGHSSILEWDPYGTPITGWDISCPTCGCANLVQEIDLGTITGNLEGLGSGGGDIGLSYTGETLGWMAGPSSDSSPLANEYRAWLEWVTGEDGITYRRAYVVFGLHVVSGEPPYVDSLIGAMGLAIDNDDASDGTWGDFAAGGAWPSEFSVVGGFTRAVIPANHTPEGTYTGTILGNSCSLTIPGIATLGQEYARSSVTIPYPSDYGVGVSDGGGS